MSSLKNTIIFFFISPKAPFSTIRESTQPVLWSTLYAHFEITHNSINRRNNVPRGTFFLFYADTPL